MSGKNAPVSVRNPLVEFSVDAETKNGDYIKVTNEGGIISLKKKYYEAIPWEIWYDKGRNAWVALLINVTRNSFRICYLFLRNGTGSFTLWHYDYEGSGLEGYLFYGADRVRNKTCLAPSVLMPEVSIVPMARSSSDISALGSALFIDDQKGLYVNGTKILSLYPILKDAGQVWFLMDDHEGRYYFSIFYFFEADREHVFCAHTIRLNDLYRPSLETIAAQWMPGRFPHALTITSDASNVTVKINDFPFRTDMSGRIEMRVPAGDITVEAQSEILVGQGARRIFSEWKWHTKSNPTSVRISRNTDLYLVYRTQFYLTIVSPHGSPTGEGWYDAGTDGRFAVEPIIDLRNGTRLLFNGWSGDKASKDPEGVIKVDGPKVLYASWKRQHEIRISTKGLPAGVAVSLTAGGNHTTLTIPFTHRQWVDADSAIMIAVHPTNITSSQARYIFRRWQTSTGATLTVPVIVRNPIELWARYEAEEPFSGKITLQAVPPTLLLDDTIIIKGATSPPRPLTNVTIMWSHNLLEWTPLTKLATDLRGGYEQIWKVPQFEKVYFKARWTYDPDYEPLESPVVEVRRIAPTGDPQSQWPHFLRSIVRILENASIPSQVIAILLYPLMKINQIAALLSAATGAPHWLHEIMVWVFTGALSGPIYLAPLLVPLVLAWKRIKHTLPSSSMFVLVVATGAVGIGLILIGRGLSISSVLQLGLAIATIAPSIATSSLVALAIAKAR